VVVCESEKEQAKDVAGAVRGWEDTLEYRNQVRIEEEEGEMISI
jgi:hypothetical protein